MRKPNMSRRTVFMPCCSWTGLQYRKFEFLNFTRLAFATRASPRTNRKTRRMCHSPDVSSSSFAAQASPEDQTNLSRLAPDSNRGPQYRFSHSDDPSFIVLTETKFSNQYDVFVMTSKQIFRVFI
jgi:hypothetical protein